jgi:hypothetical protein
MTYIYFKRRLEGTMITVVAWPIQHPALNLVLPRVGDSVKLTDDEIRVVTKVCHCYHDEGLGPYIDIWVE